jgi:hypothetical protein
MHEFQTDAPVATGDKNGFSHCGFPKELEYMGSVYLILIDRISARGNKQFHDPAGQFAIGGNGYYPFRRSLGKPDQKHHQDNFLAARQASEPGQDAGRIFVGSCIDHGAVTTQCLTGVVVRQADCYLNSIGKRRGGKKQKGYCLLYCAKAIMVFDAIYSYGVKDHMSARKLFYHKETRGDVIIEMVIWQLPENTVERPRKLFYHKETRGDVIIEMVIWQLPENTVERPHSLKYRFFCGTAETCYVRYDNEAGKGDHRHYGSQEENYPFQSIERLVEEFRSDCVRLADWEW